MTAMFPPPGYAEVAAPPARKTLFDCEAGETVLLRGQTLYLGEFRDGIAAGAAKTRRQGQYAALWGSRAEHAAGLPYLILAASWSHQVAAVLP